jgi:hypothetical protein
MDNFTELVTRYCTPISSHLTLQQEIDSLMEQVETLTNERDRAIADCEVAEANLEKIRGIV